VDAAGVDVEVLSTITPGTSSRSSSRQ